MNRQSNTSDLISRSISSALSNLRAAIRRYVLLEGLALSAIWLITSFLVFWAVDYLPVLFFGLGELPFWARLLCLVFVTTVSAWLLYRWVLCRVFARLRDTSLALLIERKFPDFDESLITTIQSVEGDDKSTNPDLLAKTRAHAEKTMALTDVGEVIDRQPLNRKLLAAGLMSLLLVGCAIVKPLDVRLAAKRLFLLDSTRWPRQCQIEVVGFKVKRENLVAGIEELNQLVTNVGDEFKVARGSSLTLLVRAAVPETKQDRASNDEAANRLPDSCVLHYRTDEGLRGKQPLKKVGAPRDGFQLYSIDGLPLQGILSDVQFSVQGDDHRVGPFQISVVDTPTIVETQLACEFPKYMVDEASMRWTPRAIRWTGHSQLPMGTDVQIVSTSNKPLKKVYAYDPKTKIMDSFSPSENGFEFPLGKLESPSSLQFFLVDVDGVVSEQPHSVSLQPIDDQPPVVKTLLDGIGNAVTPNVRIPILGKIQDDYGVARQWVSVTTLDPEPIVSDFETSQGDIETAIDFRERRQSSKENVALEPGNGNQIEVMVEAQDRFDLRSSPNIGLGDKYVLDVVTAGELLRILERLEVGQRRRLEQIYQELTDARGYLVRTKSQRKNVGVSEPGDTSDDDAEPDDTTVEPVRRDELRMLFAQRAILQIEKSIQETLGVSNEFENIRKQLINNRVDSEDRKQRLSEQIVKPLKLIATESMQELKSECDSLEVRLKALQENVTDQPVSMAADEQSKLAIEKIDEVLLELDQVLSILVKYETQNELLDIVRLLIKQQQEIGERTSKERKRNAFEGLLDDLE